MSHVWHDGTMYNGFAMGTVRSSGASRCGIDKLGGVVTKAHLLSFADLGRPIGAEDLDRGLGDAEVLAGDALLIHTGWMERWRDPAGDESTAPALAASAADWIVARDVALIGADNPAVEVYGEDELRMKLIRDRGVYLMELLSLIQPVVDGVREGLLIVAPLLISRGVGSPVNPVLVV